MERQIFDADHPGVKLHHVAIRSNFPRRIVRRANFRAGVGADLRSLPDLEARVAKLIAAKRSASPNARGTRNDEMRGRHADDRKKGGGKEKGGKEMNDKNEARERASNATASGHSAFPLLALAFKYRRLLQEGYRLQTTVAPSGQSGAIIQEEFMSNVRASPTRRSLAPSL